MAKRKAEHAEKADYYDGFTRFFLNGAYHPGFPSKRSMANQFYSDLVTPIQKQIDVPGTTIHVFYAVKMGEKYEKRYRLYFQHPDIRRHDREHEELLLCDPEEWTREVLRCCGIPVT